MSDSLDREKLEGIDPLSMLIDVTDQPREESEVSPNSDDNAYPVESSESSDRMLFLQPTRSANATSIVEKWQKIINHEPQLLTGETKTLQNIPCSLNALAGGLIHGSILMTNYRLIFIPSSENLHNNDSPLAVELCCLHLGLSYYQVPLGSIHKIEKFERRDQSSTEKVTALFLIIHCKDCRILKLQLPVCDDSIRSIGVIQSFAYANDISYLFAFEHKIDPSLDIGWDLYDIEKEFKRQGVLKPWIDDDGNKIPCPWKLSMANYDYNVCGSYPALFVVPSELDDDTVHAVGSFRSEGRMPALCWGYANNSGSIWRASQPKVGIQGNTNKADEFLLNLVASSVHYKAKHSPHHSPAMVTDVDVDEDSEQTGAYPPGLTTDPSTPSSRQSGSTTPRKGGRSFSPPRNISATRTLSTALQSTFRSSSRSVNGTKMSSHGRANTIEGVDQEGTTPLVIHIVDCRPYTSAKANLLNGYGVESSNNYPGSIISFMDMENIHSIRDSYQKLEKLCLAYNANIHLNNNKDVSWGAAVEGTRWLQHMRLFLSCALHVATVVHKLQHPVLVHCSHGWDRTPQVTAVAQLFLDPFYRTLAGFPVLVEKEFISFGHPFQKRLAHGLNPNELSEHQNSQLCPIFFQFLDAVWQLQHLFVNLFEFNSRYLLCIAEHLHSCRFGTFIMSTSQQRGMKNEIIREKSTSIWSYLQLNRKAFINISFSPPKKSSSSSPPIAFLPPKSYMLRNVSLWSDYFLRFSPHQCFSHDSFISKQVEFDNDDEDDEDEDEEEEEEEEEALGDSYDSAIQARRRYSSVKTSEIGDIYMHEASLLSADQDENLHRLHEESERWKRKALYEQKLGIGMLFGASESSPSRGSEEPILPPAVSSAECDQEKMQLLEKLSTIQEETARQLKEKEEEIGKLKQLNEAQQAQIRVLTQGEYSGGTMPNDDPLMKESQPFDRQELNKDGCDDDPVLVVNIQGPLSETDDDFVDVGSS